MASPSLFKTFFLLSATLALVTPSFGYNILYSGEALFSGQVLTEGTYFLSMQQDCNLVLYDMGQKIFETRTTEKGQGCYVIMQHDGNLVIYTSAGAAIWATNTQHSDSGNYVLVLQKDRNLVVYGPSIWHASTAKLNTNINITSNSSGRVLVNGTDKISMITDHSRHA